MDAIETVPLCEVTEIIALILGRDAKWRETFEISDRFGERRDVSKHIDVTGRVVAVGYP